MRWEEGRLLRWDFSLLASRSGHHCCMPLARSLSPDNFSPPSSSSASETQSEYIRLGHIPPPPRSSESACVSTVSDCAHTG